MKPANPFQIASLALLLSASCGYDNVSSTVINGPATVTVVGPSVSFGNYKTFSIVNAVTNVTTTSSSAPPTFTCDSSSTSQQILAAVTQNMISRGFTQGPTITCPGPNPPPGSDLAINVSVMKITNTTVYYPCYWWGYWGYPGYGCYPTYPYVSSYSTGTVVTQMSDLTTAPPDGGAISDIWEALGYSVLSSTAATSASAVASINQAFAQSPYLKTP
jgi:Domain of unknown function (DUF4136)